MNLLDLARLMIAGVIVLSAPGCSDVTPERTIRYKFSVTLQVNDQLVTESTVQEVAYKATSPTETYATRGAALGFDLARLGSLFIQGEPSLVLKSCGSEVQHSSTPQDWFDHLRANVSKGCEVQMWNLPAVLEAPPSDYDLPDFPNNSTVPAPSGFMFVKAEQISVGFSHNVRFVRAWLQASTEPISAGDFAKFRWLQPILDKRLTLMPRGSLQPWIGPGTFLIPRLIF